VKNRSLKYFRQNNLPKLFKLSKIPARKKGLICLLDPYVSLRIGPGGQKNLAFERFFYCKFFFLYLIRLF